MVRVDESELFSFVLEVMRRHAIVPLRLTWHLAVLLQVPRIHVLAEIEGDARRVVTSVLRRTGRRGH